MPQMNGHVLFLTLQHVEDNREEQKAKLLASLQSKVLIYFLAFQSA